MSVNAYKSMKIENEEAGYSINITDNGDCIEFEQSNHFIFIHGSMVPAMIEFLQSLTEGC